MIIEKELRKRLKVSEPEKVTVDQLCTLVKSILPDVLPHLAIPGEPTIEVFPLLDYMISRYGVGDTKVANLISKDGCTWTEAFPAPGGSEGVYLDVSICSTFSPDTNHIITAKTLEEGIIGHAAMGLLAGVITDMIDTFIWINY